MRTITDDEITLANTENHGYWLILISPVNDSVPTYSTSNIDLNLNNPQIWAIGHWACQRNQPFHGEIELKTSRNIGTQYIMRFIVHNVAISDSVVRMGMVSQYFYKGL